ncbi:5'-methylthioadenosine/adenosylhomocysteine nucleosidase [Bacillus carboniphilus]|uniref:adenosylhomocysteine nucleosidase n=1 Tax=Bacillus carboniphilus TaxID=86663 RepID=A0ABY9JU90_9BACI|nr:5'-methylthioadenosine/adenosylhomocysteine nucleosidase [Bacillus carboniphilus]WLR42982.1 5'-methylthioadenosine/adenosylhomocysteine nucleosidase [Bacillus carboniphilus]
MKKIGIIGAMQVEIDLLINKVQNLTKFTYAGFPFYHGELFSNEIIITNSGVGKVNAAACTQLLIDQFSVYSIINTGIAGSLDEAVKIYDVVISSDVTHHDVRVEQKKNLFPFQETFQADKQLIELALQTCAYLKLNSTYHLGRIVSGESFIEDIEEKTRIVKNYAPACVEMEGSAIAQVAHINKVPFVIIRSISDNADENTTLDYKKYEEMAANQSAQIVLGMLSEMKWP